METLAELMYVRNLLGIDIDNYDLVLSDSMGNLYDLSFVCSCEHKKIIFKINIDKME